MTRRFPPENDVADPGIGQCRRRYPDQPVSSKLRPAVWSKSSVALGEMVSSGGRLGPGGPTLAPLVSSRGRL